MLISTCLPPTFTMEAYKSNSLIRYFKNFLFEIYSISVKPWWIFEVMPFCNPTCWKQEWKSSFRKCDITYMYLYCVQFFSITIIILETKTTTVIIVMFVVAINTLKVKLYFFYTCPCVQHEGKWESGGITSCILNLGWW